VEKEGFAETRSDGANTLAVHIARHAKLLVRRELALEVTWPARRLRMLNVPPELP